LEPDQAPANEITWGRLPERGNPINKAEDRCSVKGKGEITICKNRKFPTALLACQLFAKRESQFLQIQAKQGRVWRCDSEKGLSQKQSARHFNVLRSFLVPHARGLR
jgi:hypothetical protein